MDNKVIQNRSKEFLGVGWAFPVQFSLSDLQVNMSAYEDNVNQSINMLMQTPTGNRTMLPGFGSGLQQFFFQEVNETLRGDINHVVRATLLEYEPRITVESVDAVVEDEMNGLINIYITYEFNQTNTRHNYVYPFYINEGTNLNRS